MSDLGNREVFSANLQYYMELRGRSRSDISKALNVPYTTVTDWEKGKTYPRIDKIEMLANYFNIQKADLIEEKTREDRELWELREQLRRSPETRMLFDATKHATPGQIKAVAEMLKEWKSTSD